MDDPKLIDKIFPSTASSEVVPDTSASSSSIQSDDPPVVKTSFRSARSGPSRRSPSVSPASSPETSTSVPQHFSSVPSASEPVLHHVKPAEPPKKKSMVARLMAAGSKSYNEDGFKAAKSHARSKLSNPLPKCKNTLHQMATRTVKAIVTTILFVIIIFALILLICLVVCGALHWGVALAVFVILLIIVWIAVASLKSYLEDYLKHHGDELGNDLSKWSDDFQSRLPDIFDESLDVYLKH
jgi:hypothetical protein